MLNNISIAVICPTYNSEKFVQRTIQSVLTQTRAADEFIIVDDGSSDETVSLLNKIKNEYSGPTTITIIQGKHKGPGAARNQGILVSKSNWVAFIDSDDTWYEQKLEKAAITIAQKPEFNIFCHSEAYLTFSGKNLTLKYAKHYKPDADFQKLLYQVNLFSTSATICSRKLFDIAGFFDENLSSAQDYDLWLKFAPYLKPVFIDEVLGVYNEREGNISTTKALKRLRNILVVYKRYKHYASFVIYYRQVAKTMAYFSYNYLKKVLS